MDPDFEPTDGTGIGAVKLVTGWLLLAMAVVLALISYGALRNLLADYQDSTVGTYLLVGVPFLLLAIVSAAAGVSLIVRGRRRS